ncbi:MAG: DNA translocase FtsK, partial [Gemmatimonadetes bacterium]|nr:DNA translocase FtsK [Gemmatimonadota bacterium]
MSTVGALTAAVSAALRALSRGARLSARGARVLVGTRQGRLSGLVVAAGAALWFGARDGVLWTFGWGAVPALCWLALFLFLATRGKGFRGAWGRRAVVLFGAAAAAVGGLGMVGAPSDSFGPSMGGLVGAAIARYPFEWHIDGGTVPELALAAARVGAVAALAGAVMWPSHALRAARGAATGAAMAGRTVAAGLATAYVLSIAAACAVWSRFLEYLEARAARRAAEVETKEGVADAGLDARAGVGEAPSGADEPAVAPRVEAGAGAAGVPAPEGAVTITGRREAAVSAFTWGLPAMDLLRTAPVPGVPQAEIDATSRLIVDTLAEHGVEVSIGQVRTGPTVTMYGIVPGYGRGGRAIRPPGEEEGAAAPRHGTRVRVDTILARERDLALALASPSLRFEAPVPGESLVGIEVPNSKPSSVALRTVMETEEFHRFSGKAELPFALGIGSDGEPVYTDLARMPHVLVAGATGSGKSVCINALLCGLLMVRTPADLRLVLVDPKRVELTPYDGIPHLYTPVVVEPDRTVAVLKAVANEMMRRFRVLESAGAKNIAAFNERAASKMPYIVVAVDELADLMLFAANEVERTLVRLAQLGRATGVHLVVAT